MLRRQYDVVLMSRKRQKETPPCTWQSAGVGQMRQYHSVRNYMEHNNDCCLNLKIKIMTNRSVGAGKYLVHSIHLPKNFI